MYFFPAKMLVILQRGKKYFYIYVWLDTAESNAQNMKSTAIEEGSREGVFSSERVT